MKRHNHPHRHLLEEIFLIEHTKVSVRFLYYNWCGGYNHFYHRKDRIRSVLDLVKEGMTLQQVGKKYGVTQERIRQLEANALRILRHARRKYFLNYNSYILGDMVDSNSYWCYKVLC